MIGLTRIRRLTRIRHWGAGAAKAGAVLLVLAMLAACASTERFGGQPEPPSAAPPPPPPSPPPPSPPPVDLAGRWKLTVAASGCILTLGDTPGAAEGSIAPAGGCPGNFFTSRKWTYEHEMLIIRDHKGEALVELAFVNGRFDGKTMNGAVVSLAH